MLEIDEYGLKKKTNKEKVQLKKNNIKTSSIELNEAQQKKKK